jgi:microcystin-dependent protein
MMSNVGEGDTEREKGDTGIQLTQEQRDFFQAGLSNPIDFPPNFQAWVEDAILSRLTAGNISGLAAAVLAPADLKWVVADLSANSAEYVYEDNVGAWLFLNGAVVSRDTYDGIFARFGTSFGAGDGSTTFGTPDTRGRFPLACGTNAACDLGDNDGVAEASRQPKHTHSDNLGISGGGSHTHPWSGSVSGSVQSQTITVPGSTGGASAPAGSIGGTQSAGHSHGWSGSVSGSVGGGGSTPSLSGSVGTGMNGSDAIAHICLGSVVAWIG